MLSFFSFLPLHPPSPPPPTPSLSSRLEDETKDYSWEVDHSAREQRLELEGSAGAATSQHAGTHDIPGACRGAH